jgi:SpoVK/Ycf46/Vps4 family AAA+-type ATPase
MALMKKKRNIDYPGRYAKTYSVKGTSITVAVEDALCREESGNTIVLDQVKIDDMFEDIIHAVHRNATSYNPMPKTILIYHTERTSTEEENESELNQNNNDIINSYTPQWKLTDVFIGSNEMKQIQTALTIIKYGDTLYYQWGLREVFPRDRSIVLNFHGEPGTGKSMMAEAIAHELGKKVFKVNYSELESKYVGETPKNIVEVFRRAQEEKAVLIFDEADSFLGKRLTTVNQSSDYGVNITRSVMLMEIEKYEGVVIFTTNLISNYDTAFYRRILASIRFPMPDINARSKIWETHLPAKLPLAKEISPKLLGEKYEDISGADIKDMVLQAAVICLQEGREQICMKHFDLAYQYVIDRKSHDLEFKGAKVISSAEISKEEYEEKVAKGE